MLFNSIDFVIFFPVVFVLYWVCSTNLRLRNSFILASSYVFYGWWDWKFLGLIIISSFVDYYVGKKLGKEKSEKRRKLLLYLSLFVNLGFLLYFKYFNFFIDSFVSAFTLLGKPLEISTLNIVLPVGISFYTFQTLSYTIDVYRNKLRPTDNILSFFAFVAFFPQLVAGPIERASHLLPQFSKLYRFNTDEVRSGLQLMLWGLFKKVVIADRLAILVNTVYNNPGAYSGIDFTIATLFFTFQIYCDFSGYSDIAIGLARTMGFDLMKNFDSPYFSKSITEFWRRWHISLSTWFRDYVYIPLGGSKKGKNRTYINLFTVFLVSGLWHGAAITFVIWGALHGVVIVLEKATKTIRNNVFRLIGLDKDVFSNRLFFGFVTFSIVAFAWIFFRANSFSDAQLVISKIVSLEMSELSKDIGLSNFNFNLSIVLIFTLILIEYANKRISFSGFVNSQSRVFRWAIYTVSILFILFYGVYGEDSPEFIYFQF
ncbi:MBOAT family O-acyltransferase [Kriegella aquimaris]|uniref:D-alanyl-lipoteichoic acid acyltransferase DltB, MBOAT superfamily n=1 Tax=Kriegella aquimaris TaxID=192904 RepID=A0A1G9QGU8_9FLAO|nr:MBOAT family O-acyltransferase [Kriegella aquimaris]SDM10206.1 D-alanyl-lipoteichoic acid acyltransferase DltB, MBOAT superfamily [Kriegella aquimaris]